MKVKHIGVMVALLAVGSVARAADPPQPPKNVNVEPTTPKAAALTSRAASAEMTGNPQAALKLAERAIVANPRDPWAYYDKAMALAQVGQLDRALDSFGAAEQRYSATEVVSRLMWKMAMAPLRDAGFRLCSTTRYAAACSSWAMTSTIFS